MVESRLPWWLVLLLGVWVAGLSVWSWPRAQRQVRWGAGLLSLAYLVLLFQALGGDPRTVSMSGVAPRGMAAVSWSFLVSSAVALLAGVCLVGRPAPRGQWIWFVTLTTANAVSCLICGSASVGGALLSLAAVAGIVLAYESSRSASLKWCEWLPASNPVASSSAYTPIGLVGVTGFVLALLFVGTLGYVVRVETSRATASHRFSAIPSVDRVRTALETEAVRPSTADPFELAFGRRADVIVLLAVLAFLVLSMNQPSRSVPTGAMAVRASDGFAGETDLPASDLLAQPPSPRGATS